jgi:hypothetical protein
MSTTFSCGRQLQFIRKGLRAGAAALFLRDFLPSPTYLPKDNLSLHEDNKDKEALPSRSRSMYNFSSGGVRRPGAGNLILSLERPEGAYFKKV